MRAEQKEGKAKAALIARLSTELEQAHMLARAAEATASEVKGKHEAGEDELAEVKEKLIAAERRITQLEVDKQAHEETISKQEAKLDVAKGASVKRESLSEGVMEVLYRVQNCVEHCQKFTKDCAAQGYFASRSKELLLEANSVFEALVDVAATVDKKKSRGSVIEKLEVARSGKQRFKGAGLALIAKARMGGLLGAARKAAAAASDNP
jgi:chromosome segregation ATPase